MKDATVGTAAQRSAAYRHNRQMRRCLPVFILRWIAACTLALLLSAYFELLGSQPGGLGLFMFLAAAQAVIAAIGLCVIFVFAYAWLYLSAHPD